MKWLRVCFLVMIGCWVGVASATAQGTFLQWGTCAAGPAVITDANSSGSPVAVGSLVELWNTRTNQIVATAAIGDGYSPRLPGRVVKISSPAVGSYTFQLVVYNMADPYAPDVLSCAVVVGGAGRGAPGIDVQVATTLPASICFPSAEIPTGDYVAGQGGCRVLSPLGVTLVSFEAFDTANGVLLRWETATEIDNRGFNVYRSEAETGPWTQLNAFLIPSQSSGSSSGFVYEYLDSEVVVGTAYYYLLEDLDIFGQTSQHGPVGIVFLGVPTAVKVTGFQAEALPPAQIWPVLLAVAVALGGAAGVRKSRAT